MAWRETFQLLGARLLSHHGPEAHHRCVLVAGQPVCRRCLALYPLTLVFMGLQWTPLRFEEAHAPWLVGLGLPTTLDFVLEQLGKRRYHPARVQLGAMLLSLPLGYGFSRYVRDPSDGWFWRLVLAYGVPCVLAILWRSWKIWRYTRDPLDEEPPGST